MNPMLAKVLGGEGTVREALGEPPVSEDEQDLREDVVPVLANVPRKTFRDRLRAKRHLVQQVTGEKPVAEAADKPIVPPDAEDLESSGLPYQKGMKQVKKVVLEPSDPTAEKEKYLTPMAALVAPDVTPDADKPIDPTAVPGMARSGFKAADLEREPQAPARQGRPVDPMEVLLGRVQAPPPRQDEQPEQVVTAEAAAAMMGVTPMAPAGVPLTEAELLASQGTGMPDHRAGDGKAVLSTFRRFVG